MDSASTSKDSKIKTVSRSIPHTKIPSDAAITAVLKDLRDRFKSAKTGDNVISVSSPILDSVKDFLAVQGSQRGNRTCFEPLLVSDIISELDDDTCSRMQLSVYNTLLLLFLQTTDCELVERGLYLLAAMVYRDMQLGSSQLATTRRQIEFMKAEIGEECLYPLIEYFADASHPVELRRWGSETNINSLELMCEATRRSLGGMLSIETDDSLTIICGQILKEVFDTDAQFSRGNFWPEWVDAVVYNEFPDASQPGRWNQRLIEYLESMPQELDTTLYFAQNVYTKPPTNTERPGHTSNIIKDSGTMTLWSPAVGEDFDQFLDIPLHGLFQMTIITSEASQLPPGEAKINLQFSRNEDWHCLLNGNAVVLDEVNLVMLTADVKRFKKDLATSCEDLEIQETPKSSQELLRANGHNFNSQVSHASTADTPLIQREGRGGACQPTGPPSLKLVLESGSKVRKNKEMNRSGGISRQGDSNGVVDAPDDRFAQKEPTNDGSATESQLEKTRHKHHAAAPKAKATFLLVRTQEPLTQREGDGSEKASSGSPKREIAKSVNATDVMATVNTIPDQSPPLGGILAQKVRTLAQKFPHHSPDLLRAILVTTGHNTKLATQQLQNGGPSVHVAKGAGEYEAGTSEIDQFVKDDDQFDSPSFTTLDRTDASTPKFRKPLLVNSKATPAKTSDVSVVAESGQEYTKELQAQSKPQSKTSRYSLKPKLPLMLSKTLRAAPKSQKSSQPAGKTKAETDPKRSENPPWSKLSQLASKQKKVGEEGAPDSDPYEINLTDVDDDAKSLAVKTKAKNRAPPKFSKAISRKAIAKSGQPMKRDKTKKRQPVPATMAKTAAATRPKRGAAERASQMIHNVCLSGDDTEGAKDGIEVEEALNSQKPKTTTSKNPLHPSSYTRTPDTKGDPAMVPENPENSVDIQQPKTAESGLLLIGTPVHVCPKPDIFATQEGATGNAATQVSDGFAPIAITSTKKEYQIARDFSSKLDDILSNIGGGTSPERDNSSMRVSRANNLLDGLQMALTHEMTDSVTLQKEEIPATVSLFAGEDGTTKMTAPVKHPDLEVVVTAERGTGPRSLSIIDLTKHNHAVTDREILHDAGNVAQGSIGAQVEGNSSGKQTKQEHKIVHDAPIEEQSSGEKENFYSIAPQTPKTRVLFRAVGNLRAADERENYMKQKLQGDSKIHTTDEASASRAQRMGVKLKDNSRAQDDYLSSKPLIDDHLARKPRIVPFGTKGAVSQGLLNIRRSSAAKAAKEEPPIPAHRPSGDDLKRTREGFNSEIADTQMSNRPKKRPNTRSEDEQESMQITDENEANISSSPRPRRHPAWWGSKGSSQGSRVAPNGSPQPFVSAETVDHFSRVSKKLSQEAQRESQPEEKKENPRDSNQIFGPRPRLTSIPKTGPSSPRKEGARYVKHRVKNDQYEGVETDGVVVPQKSLLDPFVGGLPRPNNGFTERLQSGVQVNTLAEMEHGLPDRLLSYTHDVQQNASKSFRSFGTGATELPTSNLPRKTNRTSFYDEQTTLVNAEIEISSSSSDLTCESVIDDESSLVTEDVEAWNMALRPHYEKLSVVIQRLHNEVLLRLTDDEEAMELLVTQYKENGDKLLINMIETRNQEKARIVDNIGKQKKQVQFIYSEASIFVHDCERQLKMSTLSNFDQHWLRKQEVVRRLIIEGRQA